MVLLVLLTLVGCGGGASLAPTTPVPGATGKVKVAVTWPTATTSGSRFIPAAATRVDIVVKCPGLPDVIGTITRPDTVCTLTVLVGTGRTVTATTYDVDGNPLTNATQNEVTVNENQTTAVSLYLGGQTGDLGQFILDANGQGMMEEILEAGGGRDIRDYYRIDGSPFYSYTVTFESLEIGGGSQQGSVNLGYAFDGWYLYAVDSVAGSVNCDWNAELQTYNTNTLTVIPQYEGPFWIRVRTDTGSLRYRITVVRNNLPTGNIEVGVQ
jgi:hypothetical protein